MFTLYYADTSKQVPDFECKHMQTARGRAEIVAGDTGRDIEVCTHDKSGGGRRIRTVIKADGSVGLPPQAHHANPREVCRKPAPCFCTPCRADRAEARA